MWTVCGDRACRVRGMQVKLRFLISKCNPLRRSCVSSAQNASEIAFFDFEVQASAEIVRVECAECRWNCVFGFRSATLCGDRVCRVRGMQVKLRFLISYKDLAQEVLENPDADILKPCTRDPQTEIVHKRSYRILMQTSSQRDLAQEIRIQRSCARGPTGSWCRDPDREILHKRSAYRDLAQEVLQDPDADIMTCTRDPHREILRKRSCRILMQRSWQRDQVLHKRSSYGDLAQEVIQDSDADKTERSCTRDPQTEILHKRSYWILMQASWQRDLGQKILIRRTCTSGPTGSWCRDPDRAILHKRSTYRDLAQEVLQDPDADIMTERSWTRDPQTEILHKWSYRILMQRSWQRDLPQEIRIQRSCARGPTGYWCRHHDREILH